MGRVSVKINRLGGKALECQRAVHLACRSQRSSHPMHLAMGDVLCLSHDARAAQTVITHPGAYPNRCQTMEPSHHVDR